MLSHLRFDIFFPKVQNLPLIVRERLQHFSRVVAPVQNDFLFPGFQRQTFDDGKFQACGCAAMADGSYVRQTNSVLPLHPVVGLDDVAQRLQGGSGSVVCRHCQIALNSVKGVAIRFELLQMFREMLDCLGVGLFVKWCGSLVVVHNSPHSVPNNFNNSVRGTSNLPRKARQTFNWLRWINR